MSETTAIYRDGKCIYKKTNNPIKHNTTGIKHDSNKIDYTLLPFESLESVVRILEYGEKKYSRDNWKKVESIRYLKAAFRHLIAYAKGEKIDSETGESHLSHCVCCLLFMIYQDIVKEE